MSAVCPHCGVYSDEHNYEHLARECYPKQLIELRQEIERLRALFRPMVRDPEWGDVARAALEGK